MSKISQFSPNRFLQCGWRRGYFVFILGGFGSLLISQISYGADADPANKPLSLRLENELQVRKPISDEKSVTFTTSDVIDGTNDRVMNLRGNAEIRRNGKVVKGDRITYDLDTDIAEVEGKAKLMKELTSFSGPKARIKMDAQLGWIESPDYELGGAMVGYGNATKAEFIEDDKILLTKPTYTTCTPGNLDWYFSSSTMEIDRTNNLGTGSDGVLRFFEVPVLYAPSFSLPFGAERKSGFLTAITGVNSSNGFDIAVPYYFNIAPNRDATVTPRYMSLRGTQLGAEYRYLEKNYSGVLSGEILPNDHITHTNRWAFSIKHAQVIRPGWNAYANIAKVSDDLYTDNFGRSVGTVISRQFLQEVGTNYAYNGWNFVARVQKFQTLQPDPINQVPIPYNREPQLNARYNNIDWNGAVVKFEGDFSRFSYAGPLTPAGAQYPTRGFNTTDRAFVNTSISYPYMTPGYYIKPKVTFQANSYNMIGNNNYSGYAQNFAIPTVSLDSGLFFERDASELAGLFGRSMLMTFEPRLFYVYTPYVNQSQIPMYDTAPIGVGISQIFAENSFIGNDRVSDNNKITAGFTSRLIDEESGVERARAIVAQRYDMTGQRVTAYGDNSTQTNLSRQQYSDLLMGVSTRLASNFNLDLYNQHNIDLNRPVATALTASWRPSPRRILNLSTLYNYNVPNAQITTLQNELSGQWPITKKLYALGRVTYDSVSNRFLNTLAGFEYDEECWAFRVVLQKFINTSQVTTQQIFFQIDLKGISGIGNNPNNILKFAIPGYAPSSMTAQPKSPFERYE